jgi:hypothetical protein
MEILEIILEILAESPSFGTFIFFLVVIGLCVLAYFLMT